MPTNPPIFTGNEVDPNAPITGAAAPTAQTKSAQDAAKLAKLRAYVDYYTGQLPPQYIQMAHDLASTGWTSDNVKLKNLLAKAGMPPSVIDRLPSIGQSLKTGNLDFIEHVAQGGKGNSQNGVLAGTTTWDNVLAALGVDDATIEAPTAAKPDDGSGAQGDALNSQLQSFINQMHGAPAANDPVMRGLTNAGISAGQQSAASRGVEGGMSGAMEQFGAQAAAAPYLQQRQGLALQGMQALNQRDLGLRADALQQLQAQNSATAANYATQQNQAANTGAMIGMGIQAVGSAAFPEYAGAFAQAPKLGAGIASTFGSGQAPTIQGQTNYGGTGSGGSNFRGGFTPSGGSGS